MKVILVEKLMMSFVLIVSYWVGIGTINRKGWLFFFYFWKSFMWHFQIYFLRVLSNKSFILTKFLFEFVAAAFLKIFFLFCEKNFFLFTFSQFVFFCQSRIFHLFRSKSTFSSWDKRLKLLSSVRFFLIFT